MTKSPLFKNPDAAVVCGVACLLLAAFCFSDAWEKRGRQRPWPARWLAI
ncbi:MAG: hypothetical protein ACLQBX_15870 [Candidatus Limnocylindrales bacterium]